MRFRHAWAILCVVSFMPASAQVSTERPGEWRYQMLAGTAFLEYPLVERNYAKFYLKCSPGSGMVIGLYSFGDLRSRAVEGKGLGLIIDGREYLVPGPVQELAGDFDEKYWSFEARIEPGPGIKSLGAARQIEIIMNAGWADEQWEADEFDRHILVGPHKVLAVTGLAPAMRSFRAACGF